uniref:Uncharacterized protein n=1 Tax=Sparus aurata TaxID=8175 RepID=A0A671UKF5_SPAAU
MDCCLPPTTPPAHNSTRYWLLDCEIGGGGGDATGSRRCKPDMEVRTDRGGWRGSGERTFARGKTGGRSGICAAERTWLAFTLAWGNAWQLQPCSPWQVNGHTPGGPEKRQLSCKHAQQSKPN